MAELRRTKAGPFYEDTLFTLQELTDAYHYFKEEGKDRYLREIIQPVEAAVAHLPKVWVFDTTVDSICHGASLKVPGVSKVESLMMAEEQVAILTLKGELVAIGTSMLTSKEIIKNTKGVAVKTSKVFMIPGTYPRIEIQG